MPPGERGVSIFNSFVSRCTDTGTSTFVSTQGAMCCSVLQCVVLQCVAMCCSRLHNQHICQHSYAGPRKHVYTHKHTHTHTHTYTHTHTPTHAYTHRLSLSISPSLSFSLSLSFPFPLSLSPSPSHTHGHTHMRLAGRQESTQIPICGAHSVCCQLSSCHFPSL